MLRYFYVHKVEPRSSSPLSWWHFLSCFYFIYVIKIYVRKHVLPKAHHWKSTFCRLFFKLGKGNAHLKVLCCKIYWNSNSPNCHQLERNKVKHPKHQKKVWKGMGEQTWKRFKQMVFENLLDYWLTVFQRSFLLFVTFSFILMLVRHICLTWSCDLVICK